FARIRPCSPPMRGSEMATEPVDGAACLAARDLVAGYLPGIDILRGVSVEAMRGQVRCVLGPNGTGKSTLLKVLFGFLSPVSGQIFRGATKLIDVPSHLMGRH